MTPRDLLMMPLFTAIALLAGCAAPAMPTAPATDATLAAAPAPAAPEAATPAAATPTKAADPVPAAPATPTPKVSKEQALEIAIKEGMAKDALSALLNPTQLDKTYGVKSINSAWRFLKSGKVVIVDAETGAVLHKK